MSSGSPTRRSPPEEAPSPRRTLERDDVVFMYVAKDRSLYDAYGATVQGWGGAHDRETVGALRARGVHPTGSMWCLTAGPRALHENADLRDAVSRDVAGEPIVVPWQVHTTYEGTPSWWGCTNHPAFRAHVRRSVCAAMAGGADGLHVDDHLGVSASVVMDAGCFCDFCMALFARHLRENPRPELLAEAGVRSFDGFDYRSFVRRRAPTREAYLAVRDSLPLFGEYADFQLRRAADHVRQLGRLAAEIVERPVTLSANTCLPLLHQAVVMPHLSWCIGEVPHHAELGGEGLLEAVEAYRMAEALDRPIAATARGYDWAHVKANGAEQLVCVWIALSYACGQRLMAPSRAWCYTDEHGTDWYEGPTDIFAPYYRFVRERGDLFRGLRTVGPTAVPPFPGDDVATREGRERLLRHLAQEEHRPLSVGGDVWVFPRAAADGRALVPLVNRAYDPASRRVARRRGLEVSLPAEVFGRRFSSATAVRPDGPPAEFPVAASGPMVTFRVPELGVWSVVLLR